MPRTTDAKRRVGARVNAKAHFAMSASDAKRTHGSAWNSRLVFGTVESVHEDDSGKRVSVFVTVMWNLNPPDASRTVNVHRMAAGVVPETIGAAAHQSLPADGQAAGADVEQDGGRRHLNFTAYSMSGSPVSPDRAHSVVETATSTTHRVLWDQEYVLQPVGGEAGADCGRCRPLPGLQSSSAGTLGRSPLLGGRKSTLWQ
jgi:hypothetical protein